MPRINFPPQFKPVLTKLGQLDEPAAEELISTVNGVAATLNHKTLTANLVSAIGQMAADEANSIVSAIVTLATVMVAHNVEVAEFVSDICASLRDPIATEGSAAPAVDLLPVLGSRLTRLLGSPGLVLSVKASFLQREHTNVLLDAKVITDIRPVFFENLEAPASTVLVHHLKLSYIHDNAPHEIYVSMDDSDLTTLKKSITRAEEKRKALKPLMMSSKLIDLGEGEAA